MLNWLFGRKLDSMLYATHTVRLHGVKFRLRKLDPFAFIEGTKSVRQIFETSKAWTAESVEASNAAITDIRRHYADVFLSCVVEPKLKKDGADGEGIPVSHLFTEWELANDLYNEIALLTYGKKNFKASV